MIKPPDRRACLSEMTRLCRECIGLTQEALSGAEDPDDDRLWRILQKRDGHLSRIRDISALLESDSPAGGTGTLSGQIRSSFEKLAEMDRRLKERLLNDLEEVGGELDKIKRGQHALKAYAPFLSGRPLLLDRKS